MAQVMFLLVEKSEDYFKNLQINLGVLVRILALHVTHEKCFTRFN